MYTALVALTCLTFSISLGVITSVPYPDDEGPGKKYGDRCESNQFCHGELVACHDGFCTCFTPEDMIYDEYTNGCVVLQGKKCVIDTSMWKVNVNCIEGSFCDDSGVCICSEGYYALANGTCSRKKFYKDACYNNDECSNGNVCMEGSCACEKRGQIFDEERKSCVSIVDAECDSEDEEFECTSHAVCRQGRCACKNGFAKSISGKCQMGFGADCNSAADHQCADIYFMCINGQCQCKHPLHQVFDERTQECLSLVFGPCTFPKNNFKTKNVTGIYDIQKCIKNALCVDKGFYSECECKSGFVQTKKGSCAPGFGESCEVDECDPITPLYCRNNKCDCYDHMQTWDATIKKCVGLVGSRCTKENSNCVEFASCVIPESEIAGQCVCDKYSVEVSNRTCIYRV